MSVPKTARTIGVAIQTGASLYATSVPETAEYLSLGQYRISRTLCHYAASVQRNATPVAGGPLCQYRGSRTGRVGHRGGSSTQIQSNRSLQTLPPPLAIPGSSMAELSTAYGVLAYVRSVRQRYHLWQNELGQYRSSNTYGVGHTGHVVGRRVSGTFCCAAASVSAHVDVPVTHPTPIIRHASYARPPVILRTSYTISPIILCPSYANCTLCIAWTALCAFHALHYAQFTDWSVEGRVQLSHSSNTAPPREIP
eukprot:61992-Rhodomonas_salina.4